MLKTRLKKLWLIARLLLLWYGITIQLNRQFISTSPYSEYTQWHPRAPWVYLQAWNIKELNDYIDVLAQEICRVEPHHKGDTHSVDLAEQRTPPVRRGIWSDYQDAKAFLPISSLIVKAQDDCGYVRRPVAISHQNEDGEHILVFFEAPKSSADMYREWLEEGK